MNYSQSVIKAQHAKLIVGYTKQVEKIYQYAYRRCKQKHAITKDFDTNKDFVIENEGFASETLPLGASRANKRIGRLLQTGMKSTLLGPLHTLMI